jgi:hypothetical protein
MFIRNDSRMIAALKRAVTMPIQAPFFQKGVQMLEFPTINLEWK